ncbi:MAG: hypothetical protein J1F16_05275 [Muribaculaceae bacterium]|nr:hypothetical protein [Muribaculaceae bacterium]
MKRKPVAATLENILKLFSKRLDNFTGESHRSYHKAFTSFQLFVVSNCHLNETIDRVTIENWLVSNFLQNLSAKTISFYLDKVSSLYSAVAFQLQGGRQPVFKEVKKVLKTINASNNYGHEIHSRVAKVKSWWKRSQEEGKTNNVIEAITSFAAYPERPLPRHVQNIWACVALDAGVPGNVVRNILTQVPPQLKFLSICEERPLKHSEVEEAARIAANSLKGEEPQWFAMRMRPRVKFEDLLNRFSLISDEIKIPELFYPLEEIAKRVGGKIVMEGRPIIRDIVFFKKRKQEIYPMFCKLYDLAWCYRTPGAGSGNYTPIPTKAMENFRKALGFLTPDFEWKPSGEMELNPGDEVVIVNGEFVNDHARILKKATLDELGNKVYRVSLIGNNGRWDIGIDARLLKKA